MAEQIIELGLKRDGTYGERGSGYAVLLDRILAILPDAGNDGDRLKTAEFRDELDYYRRQLERPESVDAAVREVPNICQEFFKRIRMYRLDREGEYVELIGVLRETVGRLAGEADVFNVDLAGSSDRLTRLIEVDDIREIKQQIAREVEDLRRVVEDKKKQDDDNFSKLSQRVEALEGKLTRAREQAVTDGLTRIPNRRSFDSTLERWIADRSRTGSPFVLGLADIDDFKKINDTHGHPIGDRVLVCAAQWLSGAIRGSDFVARYGGEEFAILFDGMSLAQAEARVHELLRTIALHRFDYNAGAQMQSVCFTLSCGIAEFSAGDTMESLIQRTDESLYEAKRKGKNRVVGKKKSRLSALFR